MLTPPTPRRIVPLLEEMGTVAGHRLVLLSLEVYASFTDLRFARIDVGNERPLPRRVPPPEAWTVALDGQPVEVLDAVGRGDRAFSNGEVRLAMSLPDAAAELTVRAAVLSGADDLEVTVAIPAG